MTGADPGAESLSVVVSCYDEAASLDGVVLGLLGALRGGRRPHEVVIVDDGSTDGTGDIALRLAREHAEVRAVRHERNLGLAESVRSGYAAARHDLVLFVPGDGQFAVADLPLFLERAPGHAVVASRRERKRSPAVRRLVSWVYNALLGRLLGLQIHDAGSVMLVRRGIVAPERLRARSVLIGAEFVLRARRLGGRVAEVPRTFVPRRGGRSRIFGPRAILAALRDLWLLHREFAPEVPSEPGHS